MIEVKRLVWDEWNVRHIARHNVTSEEVEEVCHGAFMASETYSNRLRIVGPTRSNRMLAIILGVYGDMEGSYYVVTAHNANAGETQRYRELKGEPPMTSSNKLDGETRGLRYPTEARGAIPSFQSVEEEAEFWDTHDTSDFEDAFTPATVKFARNLSESLKVRFDAETLAVLRARAQEKGVGPTTLVRMWVLEHIARDQRHSA